MTQLNIINPQAAQEENFKFSQRHAFLGMVYLEDLHSDQFKVCLEHISIIVGVDVCT